MFFALTVALFMLGNVDIVAQENAAQTTAEANEGISFVEGKTFEEVLALAKKEKKMVFIDCYTSWCGPCKMLAAKVFPQKKVGDYFNKEFVSVKVDMEKGEGVDLKKRFEVKAFPTMLFLDCDGKVINRIVGADSNIDKFLNNVKSGLGANSLSALTERFEGGERDTAFLTAYLNVLDRAYDSKKCAEVAELLLKGNEQSLLTNASLYNAFLKYNTSPLSSAFQYVLDNKVAFDAKYDKQILDRTMERTWVSYPYVFIVKDENGGCSFDKQGMNAYKAEMKKRNVAKAGEIELNIDIALAEAQGDWKKYASLCDKHIKKYGEVDSSIYNWVLRIKKNCTDPVVLKKAVGWMTRRLDNIAKEKANEKPLPPGVTRAIPMVNYEAQYKKLVKELGNS